VMTRFAEVVGFVVGTDSRHIASEKVMPLAMAFDTRNLAVVVVFGLSHFGLPGY